MKRNLFSRKMLAILFMTILTLSVVIFAGCSTKDKASDKDASSDSKNDKNNKKNKGKQCVVIDIKDYGKITVELEPDVAPITVENFINLVKEGFYDGLTFHRIINGFMIQGGAPADDSVPEKRIKGEFAANGVENTISHVRGVISMARSEQYDSASTQFFICQQDSLHLDGQYAAFGRVTEGMDVVDKIAIQTPVIDNNGTVESKNQPVINSIKLID